ncbi:tail completion protein gp17 [Ponticoccus alexandrii]|uniref:DUF3168 domain-containing protein n=1 Tax=Ponticoccus alexandrii TaxID=1943633 RepID=A0ABX7F782_9RHOB|nr:DUF3168 domain-containing protein [Ponticoccus alexandrii]ETA53982.1 hypothetical protein P279_00350 [Rhodobacteraceae bacterium PD-2]QRF66380.1 DUF3168 domain-containing protein [Ponticoccus alexandrii]
MLEHVTARLLGDAALAALIGTRLHWRRLPRGVNARPYVILQTIAGPDDYHSRGNANLQTDTLQADAYADTYDDALAVVRALRARLGGYSGTGQGANVRAIFNDGWRDLSDQTVNAEAQLFRLSLDFTVHWKAET